MATRCARCQKEEVTLETFGVFRCPTCGRVDADGNILDTATPRTGEAASDERVSFAAGPPWIPPDVAERARAELTGVEADGPPTYLFAAVAIMGIIALASAMSTGAWMPTILRSATLAALATGRPWARTLSILGSALAIVGVFIVFGALRSFLPPSATPVLVVGLLAEGAWLYVLFRGDTVRYFTRA